MHVPGHIRAQRFIGALLIKLLLLHKTCSLNDGMKLRDYFFLLLPFFIVESARPCRGKGVGGGGKKEGRTKAWQLFLVIADLLDKSARGWSLLKKKKKAKKEKKTSNKSLGNKWWKALRWRGAILVKSIIYTVSLGEVDDRSRGAEVCPCVITVQICLTRNRPGSGSRDFYLLRLNSSPRPCLINKHRVSNARPMARSRQFVSV